MGWKLHEMTPLARARVDAALSQAIEQEKKRVAAGKNLVGADRSSAGSVQEVNVAGSQSGNDSPLAELKNEVVKHPLSFTIPGPPVPAPRMTRSDQWRKPPRPCVARYFEYRDRLRRVVGRRDVPVSITLRFGVPMPQSWKQSKKDLMEGQPCRGYCDVDNLCKSVFDGLWDDDKGIAELHASKYWHCGNGVTEIEIK